MCGEVQACLVLHSWLVGVAWVGGGVEWGGYKEAVLCKKQKRRAQVQQRGGRAGLCCKDALTHHI